MDQIRHHAHHSVGRPMSPTQHPRGPIQLELIFEESENVGTKIRNVKSHCGQSLAYHMMDSCCKQWIDECTFRLSRETLVVSNTLPQIVDSRRTVWQSHWYEAAGSRTARHRKRRKTANLHSNYEFGAWVRHKCHSAMAIYTHFRGRAVFALASSAACFFASFCISGNARHDYVRCA